MVKILENLASSSGMSWKWPTCKRGTKIRPRFWHTGVQLPMPRANHVLWRQLVPELRRDSILVAKSNGLSTWSSSWLPCKFVYLNIMPLQHVLSCAGRDNSWPFASSRSAMKAAEFILEDHRAPHAESSSHTALGRIRFMTRPRRALPKLRTSIGSTAAFSDLV